MPEDTDTYPDLYERFGGKTYLITDFLSGTPSLSASIPLRATPDLNHVFFDTRNASCPPTRTAVLGHL